MIEFLAEVVSVYIERLEFFIDLTFEHIWISSIAIFSITIIGIPLGIYITRHKKIAALVIGMTNLLYTIPVVALFGLIIPIVGIGVKNALLALFIYGLLPVVKNTYTGIMEVDDSIIESAKGMGSTNWQLLKNIQFPLALPVILSGFRLMAVMTIAMTAVAAFIGAGGLGVSIWRGITTDYPALTFAGSLLVAALAIVVDGILGAIERKIIEKIKGKEEGGGG